ncbi:biotin--[acetyl-CoA-carboxylase] ligase [Desulfonatronospira sp.]|uniref:biotin--[acetyl-CoA-carboxylase] ligase n=1 Tax=Desulfonatronospira sp. TaxID=1962951 RepID=UPI0025C42885|nr:biotin--[acetyl-CoA-carboxylase] ligase [Desulfonatronospira sp.]
MFKRSWRDFKVIELQECTSSLDTAWDLITDKRLLPGDSVICLQQTRGRGRMRRNWSSPPGNIYAALHLPAPAPERFNSLLSIVLGFCFQRALACRGIQAFIKWPNDLVVDSGKAGGILIEEKKGGLLAGIGINLKSAPKDAEMRRDRSMQASDLSRQWPGADPAGAWAQLVYWGHFWYDETLCNYSLIDFISEVKPYLWLLNQKVRVEQDNGVLEGYLQGIDGSGGIMLECSGRIKHVRTGALLS